jgi:importin-4
MKGAITPWTEPMLELFYRALGDGDAEVMSNAAFASGMLVEHSNADLSPQFQPLLGALHPLFVVPEGAPQPRLAAKDNAVGAVGRLIVRNTAAVPLDKVLPIFVGALPLRSDYLENKPVFRAIFHLYQTNPSALAPYTDKLLAVFATVLDPENADQLTDDTRAPLLDLIRALNSQAPAQVQAAGLTVYI